MAATALDGPRRVQHRHRRYPTDMTDAEWLLVAPLLPVPAAATPVGGRPEAHHRRVVVDAIRYVVDNGCKWRALPTDFPPWQTVYGFFARWARAGVVQRIQDELCRIARMRAGRLPYPRAAVLDSQSVRAAETVGRRSRGYDAGKKINGRKRHLVVDTNGLPLLVTVTPADVQDRDAARDVLLLLRRRHPLVRVIWADGAYAGTLIPWAQRLLRFTVTVVKKRVDQVGFVPLPRRWVVERTLSWLNRARRAVRDYDRLTAHTEAALGWIAITLLTKRITRSPAGHGQTALR